MATEFNTEGLSPQELSRHLKQPQGQVGREIGLQMNTGNRHICLNSYLELQPQTSDKILEIGMGNGFFVNDLMNMAEAMDYTGVDFSSTMAEEASNINKELVQNGNVKFECASIESLPLDDHSFDRITTTNTLYFWPQPKKNIRELQRLLKPGGKILIAYRSKSCMDQLEFTKHGFIKYDPKDVEVLLREAGFENISTNIIKEPELDFDGTTMSMEGFYTAGFKI